MTRKTTYGCVSAVTTSGFDNRDCALTRDPHRRQLVTGVSNVVGGSVYSSIAYGHDVLGSVTNRNGDAFSYNHRSEVSDAVVGANLFSYSYDGIGNLVWSADNALTNTYAANLLNQYTAISAPAREPQYDADGNLTAVGQLSLTWDAENRNIAVLSNGNPLAANSYDSQHRRVIKTTPAATHVFLYDGWLPVLEKIIRADSSAEVREHVWGKDISGTRGGAGGVGGLLATRIGNAWYFPLYDNNGNITDYVNESGATVAHREYDPFGRTTVATGTMVNDFNFWFSTKYLDHETGLYYYGYRFYSPELMRWINRDPIEEDGGINLYVMCGNNPVCFYDSLGLVKMITVPWKVMRIREGLLSIVSGNPLDYISIKLKLLKGAKAAYDLYGRYKDAQLVTKHFKVLFTQDVPYCYVLKRIEQGKNVEFYGIELGGGEGMSGSILEARIRFKVIDTHVYGPPDKRAGW